MKWLKDCYAADEIINFKPDRQFWNYQWLGIAKLVFYMTKKSNFYIACMFDKVARERKQC